MSKKAAFWIGLISIILNIYCSSAQPSGSLVIVGGGLEADNKAVFEEFIRLAGGKEHARIAVIPTASGVPVQSWISFRNILKAYGLREDQLLLVPVAMVDDDSTTDFNENQWKDNGMDQSLAAKTEQCSGIWFTGGDQIRTWACLCRGEQHTSPVLEAIRKVYARGGVIGGTSAGAAIMSNPMIGGGSSKSALQFGVDAGSVLPDTDPKGMFLLPGLGFFPVGLVDQHFHQRARTARLLVALMHESCIGKPGFGIDENTALVYYSNTNRCKVFGQGGVSLFQTHKARMLQTENGIQLENIRFSYLEEGDGVDARNLSIIPDPARTEIADSLISNAYFSAQSGLLDSYLPDFRETLVRGLVLNKNSQLQSLSFTGEAIGYRVVIQKLPDYKALRSGKQSGGKYTLTGLRMDILPFQFILKP